MWRSTVFSEAENSDQSISEDDDLDGDLPEDDVSSGIPAEEKGKVEILSQLDMLTDASEVMHERHQMSLLEKRQADICVEDDVEFPIFANTLQGASECNSDEEILSDNEVGGNCIQSFTSEYNYKTKSIEEKTSISLIGDKRYIEDDDSDHLGSFSSEEDEKKNEIEVVRPKKKTIADQFHEVLGAATNEEGHVDAGFGLFRKLQRVIQNTKERDLYFLSKLQKEQDEASCLEVKILSKCLEGKLTVCSCSSSSSSIENEEQSWLGKDLRVIFSSRVCNHVDLQVGMLLRIHPPWKQVNVKGITILSTYFSQI